MMAGRMPPEFDFARRRPVVPPPSQFHASIKTKAPRLDNIILKMIALNKEDRHQSMQEVINDLSPIFNSYS